MRRLHPWRVLSAVGLLGALAAAAIPHAASASVSVTSLGTPYTQNFDTLKNDGDYEPWRNDTNSNPTIVGWFASRPDYLVGDGSVQQGRASAINALYSFGTVLSTDRALGSIPNTSIGTIYYGVRLTNNTGNIITSLDVNYTGEQWHVGNRTNAQNLAVSYQVGATVTSLTDGTFTNVPALNFVGPVQTGANTGLDGNAAENRVAVAGTISGLSIQPGQEIMIRWADSNDGGDDNGLSIDDLSVTANGTPVPPPNPCPTPVTGKIGSVQGTTDPSPAVGQTVVLSGTVVGDFQGGTGLNGFYIQDDGDANAATSDGIFVFVPSANTLSSVDVVAGESVQVAGTVAEFQDQTQLTTVTAISKCGVGVNIAPTVVNLPETTNGELERYEGMLVNMPQTLTVQQNFFLGRFGQLTLGVGRLYQPTNQFRPNTPEAQALANLNARSLVVLDDGKSGQNPNPIPYIGADNTVRAGDTTSNLTGILDFGAINSVTTIRDYRLQPTTAVSFVRANARTATPDNVGGNVKVASFNVLNYFNTIDQSGAACFPSNTRSDCRGANSADEFERQRNKIIAAINALNADVVGLIEIENDGSGPDSAIQNLVDGLNAATAPNTYAVVADPAGIGPAAGAGVYPGGDDAIKTALIYKPAKVTLVGTAAASPSDAFANARAPIAQTFQLTGNNEKFSVVVNHFKSKGGCPASATDPDADKGDGQGCWNASRVSQANALINFVNTTVIPAAGDQDVLVIGDLNAYGKEDPIAALTANGMVDQLGKRITNPYSYVFDGLAGYLDHALTTSSLDAQVSGITEWHINADEPSVLDYNTEFKPQDLYAPTAYRSSDHDPVLIGMNLQSGPVVRQYFLPYIGK